MRKKTSMIIVLLSILWVLFSLGWSIKKGTWEWIGRSGSIVTLAGAFISGSAIWRTARAACNDPTWTGLPVVGEMGKIDYDKNGNMLFVPSAEAIRHRHENQLSAIEARKGLILGIIGTLIWGYGDSLLEKCFPLLHH